MSMNLSGTATFAGNTPRLGKRKRVTGSPSPSLSSVSSSYSVAMSTTLSDAGTDDDFNAISTKIGKKVEPVKESELKRLKAKLDEDYRAKLEKMTNKVTEYFANKTQSMAAQKLLDREARRQEKRDAKKAARRSASKSHTPAIPPQHTTSPQTSSGYR